MTTTRAGSGKPTTRVVDAALFRQVYDSPRSLPGKHKWLTTEKDVRKLEGLLGMEPNTVGAPLWVSGDTRKCTGCGRETNWLDIVASALKQTHKRELIAKIILGDKKFVNTEAPSAIEGLFCYRCRQPITDLRSFKCHNWAYAVGDLRRVVESLTRA